MSKFIFSFFSFVVFIGLYPTIVFAQLSTVAQASASIVDQGKAAQVKYIPNFSQNVSNSSAISVKPIVIASGNGKFNNSSVQNLASFSITSENNNSFSVSLPSHPLIIQSSKSNNTLSVDNWQSNSQSCWGENQKNIWVVNLKASLKMGCDNNNQAGEYFGTYFVTFVYN